MFSWTPNILRANGGSESIRPFLHDVVSFEDYIFGLASFAASSTGPPLRPPPRLRPLRFLPFVIGASHLTFPLAVFEAFVKLRKSIKPDGPKIRVIPMQVGLYHKQHTTD